jgi:hypothetical protein
MRTTCFKLGLLLTIATCLPASVVGGFINRTIHPGDNLIANQLSNAGDHSINSILLGVADGATFTKWDATANSFLPASVFDGSSQTWSINYTLNLGEGALLNSPAQTINTFIGDVVPFDNILPGLGGPLWAPNYADGLHLISCPVPVAGSLMNNAMFDKVVGRAPEAGESVMTLNESTQTYQVATFDGWDWDTDLSLAVGQAAWFNLGPVIVPEPSSLALMSLAAGALCFARRRR